MFDNSHLSSFDENLYFPGVATGVPGNSREYGSFNRSLLGRHPAALAVPRSEDPGQVHGARREATRLNPSSHSFPCVSHEKSDRRDELKCSGFFSSFHVRTLFVLHVSFCCVRQKKKMRAYSSMPLYTTVNVLKPPNPQNRQFHSNPAEFIKIRHSANCSAIHPEFMKIRKFLENYRPPAIIL